MPLCLRSHSPPLSITKIFCMKPFVFFALFIPLFLQAQTPEQESGNIELQDTHLEKKTQLTWSEAVILGLVEGITEYLPISSTGHLILTNNLLGLDHETPIYDAEGNPIWIEPPTLSEPGIPLTFKDNVDQYIIVIQGGAILAVVLLYWKRLFSMARGILGKDRSGLYLARNLIISFIPAVIFGLLLESWIEERLFGTIPVVIALVLGGFLMLLVEKRRKKKSPEPPQASPGPDLHELSMRKALIIGLLQCVALWPGTSRSMMTIVGGYLVGLSPVRSAEYSFLLGLITLSAAAGYKGLQGGTTMLTTLGLMPVLLGCFMALISALVAVRWLVGFLNRHGLAPFAYYRFLLAAVVLGALFLFD